MSSQSPMDLYQQALNKLNQVLSVYNNILDDQADRSALENVFNTGGEYTQPTIPTISDVLNTLAENDANAAVASQANIEQQLIDAFNSTAQASANKINQLVNNTKTSASTATTVAKAPKAIPTDVYELVYELTGITAGAIWAWFQHAEFKDLDNRLPTLVSLLDKLISMLANYQSGGQSESVG
ncbi:hypothetical protein [Thermofilum sp.]|uniref:hypothetical protein n=1 Tax=Thermofilum sp. TaxID=1961369 RepID=UPI003173210F